jgi:hypothetical protein
MKRSELRSGHHYEQDLLAYSGGDSGRSCVDCTRRTLLSGFERLLPFAFALMDRLYPGARK